jgi:hypothetical protein
MKSKFLFLLLIVLSNPVFSQEKKEVIQGDELNAEIPKNGKVVDGVYSCNLFNWKIEIPDGYTVMEIKKIEELEKKGFEATAVPKGTQIRRNPPHLIAFEKDKKNNFSSSFEPLEGTKKMTLEENKNFVANILSDTYSKIPGVKFELIKSDVKIGKYDFYNIEIKLYNATTNKLLVTQEFYNSYINNHLFSVSINYVNEDEGMLLTLNFLKSLNK